MHASQSDDFLTVDLLCFVLRNFTNFQKKTIWSKSHYIEMRELENVLKLYWTFQSEISSHNCYLFGVQPFLILGS